MSGSFFPDIFGISLLSALPHLQQVRIGVRNNLHLGIMLLPGVLPVAQLHHLTGRQRPKEPLQSLLGTLLFGGKDGNIGLTAYTPSQTSGLSPSEGSGPARGWSQGWSPAGFRALPEKQYPDYTESEGSSTYRQEYPKPSQEQRPYSPTP